LALTPYNLERDKFIGLDETLRLAFEEHKQSAERYCARKSVNA
jgi:hypothetical protein